ncbi:MAG TPA: hypothetical protein PKA05_06710 [Roseiflexaceae bacterium]|nr:hypothetical protein [Roseiflexaceae bacterium]
MPGGLKSGLLFAVIAIVVVFALSFIPTLGVLCCGPLGALALGVLAGYIGVRWGGDEAGIGQGVLAGGVAGAGALVGVLFFGVAALLLIRATPEMYNEMMRQILEQQPDAGLTAADMDVLFPIVLFAVVFCIGVIEVLFALCSGALGGWLAVRQRQAPPAAPGSPYVPPGAAVG